MAFSRIRWRLTELIRSALIATPVDHPLRRAYRALRAAPVIRWLWRLLRSGDDWRRVDLYESRGGRFRGSADTTGPPPPFGEEAYFLDLIERIRLAKPFYAPEARTIALLNEGLAAGGAERQIVMTLKGLRDLGYRPFFIGEHLGRAPGLDFYAKELREAGIEISAPPHAASPGRSLYSEVSRATAEALAAAPIDVMMSMLDMAALIGRRKPAVVHLWQDGVATRHAFSALLAGAPRILISTRNIDPTHFSYHRPFMRAAYRALATLPEVIFTNNSTAGAESYARWLGLDSARVNVIRNGVNVDAFRRDEALGAQFRAGLGIKAEEFVVVGVFRLSEEKRPLLWVDAAMRALERAPSLQFLIVGSGHLEADVREKIAKSRMTSRIRLLGEIADMRALLSAADAMAMTSSYEGTPNALLEAQAAGVYCLTTDAGGAREALLDGVTGKVLEDDGADAIGAAIAAIALRPTALDRARSDGPEFVRNSYGVNRMLDEHIAAYGC